MKAIVLMIAGVLSASSAGSADTSPKIKTGPVSSDNIHVYGTKNPSCVVWTDGCRRCDRASGTPSCSNIGIACQPGPVKCDAEPPPAK